MQPLPHLLYLMSSYFSIKNSKPHNLVPRAVLKRSFSPLFRLPLVAKRCAGDEAENLYILREVLIPLTNIVHAS